MRNKILYCMLVLFSFLCISANNDMGIASSSNKFKVDAGPEEIILKTPASIKSAQFPHRKHQDAFACSLCHHSKNDDGIKLPYTEGMKIHKCVACHNKEDMISPKLNNFKIVAHGLCKGCHKKQKGTAPTRCSGCHIK